MLFRSIDNTPDHGTLGDITVTDLDTAEVVYTPDGAWGGGADSFGFVVNDGEKSSAAAVIVIQVM